jgi:hypothetical protein
MNNYESNRAWHDAWNETESGKLEWERVARISDKHMTTAITPPTKTPDGIAAKVVLYRATVDCFDDDPYILDHIQADTEGLLRHLGVEV